MFDKLKVILGVAIGIVIAVILFCLIVVIACSVNGLTFGEQIVEWFGGNASKIEQVTEQTKTMVTK